VKADRLDIEPARPVNRTSNALLQCHYALWSVVTFSYFSSVYVDKLLYGSFSVFARLVACKNYDLKKPAAAARRIFYGR